MQKKIAEYHREWHYMTIIVGNLISNKAKEAMFHKYSKNIIITT